jgi:hypothetical protein
VIAAVCALMSTSCTAPDADVPVRDERFEGVITRVAGEPVFRSEVDALAAQGVGTTLALERLRVHALLASAARKSATRSEVALEMVRKRAAVQLYLRDLRASTEPPSDALVRERYEASGETRPFDDVSGALRDAILNERTFARIAENVAAAGERFGPEVMPESLPDTGALRFVDGAR